MRRLLIVIVALALAGCIGPPVDTNCTTYEDPLPNAILDISPENVEDYEIGGFFCVPYEMNYCEGQCENGVCPEPGVYSYQCVLEV